MRGSSQGSFIARREAVGGAGLDSWGMMRLGYLRCAVLLKALGIEVWS